MKTFILLLLIGLSVVGVPGQDAKRKIYETERAFEKMVAEKGIRDGFIEFLSPLGIMFMPDLVSGREAWKARPASPAALTWNPIWIDVSSNGSLAYSIGNSMYRPKGKDDANIVYGHYLSIWARQANGDYRAALDTGTNHRKPTAIPTEWKSPQPASEKLAASGSAGDNSTAFYSAVESQGSAAAYSSFLTDDAIVMRDGVEPFFGQKAAIAHLKKEKAKIVFARRKSFVEAGDLAYINSTYQIIDKNGMEKEKGNFVQVWKLTGRGWKIAADVFVPLPKPTN